MYIGFVSAGFEDELLRLVMPVLDWGVRCCQTGWPQGQTRLSMPFFIPFLELSLKVLLLKMAGRGITHIVTLDIMYRWSQM